MPKINYALFAAFFLLLVINAFHINRYYLPILFFDEFAYLGIAGYFAGLDWSSTIYFVGYYSFGYSFLLVPFFIIFDNPTHIYLAAIILNVLLAGSSFFIIYSIAGRVLNKSGQFTRIAIAFTLSMYSSYLLHVHLAWAESLLTFVVWAVFLICIKIEEKATNRLIILFSILLSYAFAIHMRTLGILIAGIIVIILFKKYKKITYRQLLLFFSLLIVAFICTILLREYLLDVLWMNSASSEINDIRHTAGRLGVFTDVSRFNNFLRAAFGQIYYLMGASYLLVVFGAFFIKNRVMQKDMNTSVYSYTFIAVAFILSFGISTLFMSGFGRIDHLIYGRYNEIILGPFLLMGFAYLLYEKKAGVLATSLGVFFISAMVTLHTVLTRELSWVNLVNIPGLLFADGMIYGTLNRIITAGFVVSSLIGCVVYVAICNKKCKAILYSALLGICILFSIPPTIIITRHLHNFHAAYQYASEIALHISASDVRIVHYFLDDRPRHDLDKNKLQFMMPNIPLTVVHMPYQEKYLREYAPRFIVTHNYNFLSQGNELLALFMQTHHIAVEIHSLILWELGQAEFEPALTNNYAFGVYVYEPALQGRWSRRSSVFGISNPEGQPYLRIEMQVMGHIPLDVYVQHVDVYIDGIHVHGQVLRDGIYELLIPVPCTAPKANHVVRLRFAGQMNVETDPRELSVAIRDMRFECLKHIHLPHS